MSNDTNESLSFESLILNESDSQKWIKLSKTSQFKHFHAQESWDMKRSLKYMIFRELKEQIKTKIHNIASKI